MGIYKRGFVTAYQYQSLTAMQEANNLLQDILDNNIIQANDKFMQKALIFYISIDFNDISEPGLNKFTYKSSYAHFLNSLKNFLGLPVNSLNHYSIALNL